jgi:hypothetical protein
MFITYLQLVDFGSFGSRTVMSGSIVCDSAAHLYYTPRMFLECNECVWIVPGTVDSNGDPL